MMERVSIVVYDKIVGEIHQLNCRYVTSTLKDKFPNVSEKILECILAQNYQRKMKRSHVKHHQPDVIQFYYNKFLEGIELKKPHGFLTTLADEADLSPSLMGKLILEQYLIRSNKKPPSKQELLSLIKETGLIKCPILSLELHLCHLNDEQYGPIIDAIKHSIGYEYEFKLKLQLNEMGITFLGEDEMRIQGYDKTPDVKLEIPVAINGKVINWVESKALFGDKESHKNYLEEQLWSYWNRFGPGLVIYWFGFIEELDVHGEKGILMRTDFPTEVTKMNPQVLKSF